jgi:hypothetical protein
MQRPAKDLVSIVGCWPFSTPYQSLLQQQTHNMQHGKFLVKLCEYIQLSYDGFVCWGVRLPAILFLTVRAHVNCGEVVHRLNFNQQSIPDPSQSLFEALVNYNTWCGYKIGSCLNIIYFVLFYTHNMTNSVRSRKNGASRVSTKHATGSVSSIAPGAPSTRKTLSFVGAILFGASLLFWLVDNIKLPKVKWRSPSTTDEEWQDRREQVKDAFTSSWDAYTRYAWGKSALTRCCTGN